jgi:hypothetical protein
MKRITCFMICFLSSVTLLSTALVAQGPDPLSGTWTGDWGPSARDRNNVTVQFKWDGKTLSGTVNPGPNAITLQKTSFNPQTGAVHLEADATTGAGRMIHYVIDGTVANGAMTGSWNHDNVKGDFKISKK